MSVYVNGWVIGDQLCREWIQILPDGRQRHFNNVYRQTIEQIKDLCRDRQLHEQFCRSYIVFGNHCVLKRLKLINDRFTTTRRNVLLRHVINDLKYEPDILDDAEVDRVYYRIVRYSMNTGEEKPKVSGAGEIICLW